MTYTDTDGSIRCTNPAPTNPATHENTRTGVVGGAVGGTIGGLALLSAILWYLYRRRRRSVQVRPEMSRLPSEIGDDQSRKVEPDVSLTGATGFMA
jgi:LPXTG-motif cell wall-anchored protein